MEVLEKAKCLKVKNDRMDGVVKRIFCRSIVSMCDLDDLGMVARKEV
jgi:hypothetical protein